MWADLHSNTYSMWKLRVVTNVNNKKIEICATVYCMPDIAVWTGTLCNTGVSQLVLALLNVARITFLSGIKTNLLFVHKENFMQWIIFVNKTPTGKENKNLF